MMENPGYSLSELKQREHPMLMHNLYTHTVLSSRAAAEGSSNEVSAERVR